MVSYIDSKVLHWVTKPVSHTLLLVDHLRCILPDTGIQLLSQMPLNLCLYVKVAL